MTTHPALASTTAAATPARFEFATLAPFSDQPAVIAGVAAAAGAVLLLIAWQYSRERTSLTRAQLLLLLTLRLGAAAAVILFALCPQKRAARQETRPSQVVVLVDDSLSMTLPETSARSDAPIATRTEVAEQLLDPERDGLIAHLRASHQVHVAPAGAARSAAVFPLQRAAGHPDEPAPQGEEAADLAELLAAHAAETRLGDALQEALGMSGGGPLAGIVLLSDGQNNAGASPELVAAAAREAGVPIHTIGLGSLTPARNLAVRDLAAPSRAYPKDEIELTAMLEAQGFTPERVTASLYARRAGEQTAPETLLETKIVPQLAPGQPTPQKFAVRPETAGRYEYRLALAPAPEEANVDDNQATVEVHVVDRVLRALLIAGGPTRDYRFLRDQLRRDDQFTADVWLQSSPPGVSQDAHEVLDGVPDDQEQLEAYDLFVAFDADWTQVSSRDVERISRCVSERGAGFVFVAGPVQTPRWLRDRQSQTLKTLLPVVPAAGPLLLGPSERTSPSPSPVTLTRAGREAPMLWVRGEQRSSVDFWEAFPGFYATAAVEDVKPGAVVYATATPPPGAGERRAPVVFAEQFFGAGRCFYIGAPEMWRLRAEDPAVMRAFYTKTLQHVSQGRLLADSLAGSLLFERDRYNVGDTLTLRATLTEKAAADADPAAPLNTQVELPGGELVTLELAPVEGDGHAWSGGLRAQVEGRVRASLTLASQREPLTATTTVTVPALERSRAQRDGQRLARIAELSGGRYYGEGELALTGGEGLPPLAEAIPSRTETLTVYGAPDEAFARRVSSWLLAVIATCLLTEWTTRRALSLA